MRYPVVIGRRVSEEIERGVQRLCVGRQWTSSALVYSAYWQLAEEPTSVFAEHHCMGPAISLGPAGRAVEWAASRPVSGVTVWLRRRAQEMSLSPRIYGEWESA